ncbi:MAG: hypothetical protein WCT36_05020, partial [Candidatus Gracilibacteria bacterium]
MAKAQETAKPKSGKGIIRYIYLYLVTAITIVMIIISVVGFLNLVLKEYVLNVKDYIQVGGPYECTDAQLFTTYDVNGKAIVQTAPVLTPTQMQAKRDKCVKTSEEQIALNHVNDIKRSLAEYLSMILVAFPLYLYHWGIIK